MVIARTAHSESRAPEYLATWLTKKNKPWLISTRTIFISVYYYRASELNDCFSSRNRKEGSDLHQLGLEQMFE